MPSQGTWTLTPGLPLAKSLIFDFASDGWFALRFPSSSSLEFLLNDGVPRLWLKSSSGENFKANSPGVWILRKTLEKWSPCAGAASSSNDARASPSAARAHPSPSPTDDPLALAQEGGIILLYHTPWTRPHLHYRADPQSAWTVPPGQLLQLSGFNGFPGSGGWFALRLPEAQQLEFVPNDGAANWDKAPGGKNYAILKAGAWTLKSGRLEEVLATTAPPALASSLPVVPIIAAASATPLLPGAPCLTSAALRPIAPQPEAPTESLLQLTGIVLLYRSAWPNPHLHCRELKDSAEPGQWTQLPGLILSKAPDSLALDLKDLDAMSHGSLFALHLPSVTAMEFVIDDGGPHYRWDKAPGGGNFKVSPGTWYLSSGRLEKLQPAPVAPKPSIVSVSRTAVTLSWTPTSGLTGIRGYRIFRNGQLVVRNFWDQT